MVYRVFLSGIAAFVGPVDAGHRVDASPLQVPSAEESAELSRTYMAHMSAISQQLAGLDGRLASLERLAGASAIRHAAGRR